MIIFYTFQKKKRDIKKGANDELGYDSINHVSQDNIGVVSHKIIKYINDNMYSEENRANIYCNWVDLSDWGLEYARSNNVSNKSFSTK